MNQLFVAARTLVYVPGFVALWGWLVLAAARLDRSAGRTLPDLPGIRVAGIVLIVAGSLLALTCVAYLVVWGKGTPAPFDAPKRFVALGPYRFLRNPMYVGAIALLTGLAFVLEAPSVLGLALAACFFSNLFVILVEEPGLARRFGESYAAYRRATNRWVPRVPRA